MQWEGKLWKNRYDTCMTMNLHINLFWSKSYLAKHSVTALEHLPYALDLLLLDFPVSMNKKCSERIIIREHQWSHCRSDESIDRCQKMVSKNASKSFTDIGESVSLLKKCYVNRYEVTYFCVINSGNFLKRVVCLYRLWNWVVMPPSSLMMFSVFTKFRGHL